MAARKKNKRSAPVRRAADGDVKFPYTNTPGALKTFLGEAPKRPKPSKINIDLLKSWGMRDTNAGSIIRVLKSVGLVDDGNKPTQSYEAFMTPTVGPAKLGQLVQEVYAKLFEMHHAPQNESATTLKNFFHIHGGGSDGVTKFQVQTFKALADYAIFSKGGAVAAADAPTASLAGVALPTGNASGPRVHIDLHIHLPPNKSAREYEAMFQDIGKYIYGPATSEG